MKSKKHIVQKALWVGIAASLSRLTGYLRDITLAIFLGAGFSMDAFAVAFRVANLFRRFFGESSVQACFLPAFIHYQKNIKKQDKWEFARRFFYSFLLILSVLALGVILGAPLFIRILAPGFGSEPEKIALSVLLSRVMAPFIVTVGASALLAGILNSMNVFFLPSLMPVVLNVTVIVSAFAILPLFPEPSVGIAAGVLLGGLLQLLMGAVLAKRCGMVLRPTLHLGHPESVQVLKAFGPMTIGFMIGELHLLCSFFFASFLAQGSVASLYYADRVGGIVLGIVPISFATVLLPSLSRAARDGDAAPARTLVGTIVRLTLFVSVPSVVAFALLSREIISTLFQYGNFGPADVERTSWALFFLSFGLCFMAISKIINTSFFALKDTKTPVKGFAVGLLVNLIGCSLFFKILGVGGIMLANSLSALANLLFLLWRLNRTGLGPHFSKIFISAGKIAAGSAALGLSLLAGIRLFQFKAGGPVLSRALPLAAAIVAGIAVYLIAVRLLRCPELSEIKKYVYRPPAEPLNGPPVSG